MTKHKCCFVQEAPAYLCELQELLHSIANTEFQLNSPEYWAGVFYELPKQEKCLQVSSAVSVSVCVCGHILYILHCGSHTVIKTCYLVPTTVNSILLFLIF